MVDILKQYHNSYPEFFTQEECDYIIQVFEEDKDSIPHGFNTGYDNTLTSTYTEYNWLHNPKLQDLNIEQRLFNLPEFARWRHMTIQCWGNAIHVGEELKPHYHGSDIQHEFMRRKMFYNCNVFLGGEYNLTHYNDIGYKENKIGDIHVFSCDLEHKVDKNTGADTRYSMAFDIYPEITGQDINDSFTSARFKIALNEHSKYTDTNAMRFYTARALFAADFHNQKIMDASRDGDHEKVKRHKDLLDKLKIWMSDYKDYIHELEETNRTYGFEPDIPPLDFTIDRKRGKSEPIYSNKIPDYE